MRQTTMLAIIMLNQVQITPLFDMALSTAEEWISVTNKVDNN